MFNGGGGGGGGGLGLPDRNAPKMAALHLRDAEGQRKADADEAMARAPKSSSSSSSSSASTAAATASPTTLSSLASRGNAEAAAVFADIVACERFRDSVSLNRPCRIRDKSLTCADLITSIAWELADSRDLASLLEIESSERFISLLQTACTYEAEVAKVCTLGMFSLCLFPTSTLVPGHFGHPCL
jgi:hypothetical protein